MTDLPQSFIDPKARRAAGGLARLWLAMLLALVSGWQVFALPGTFIQVLRLPEDVQGFGVGLRGVFVQPDGTWIIRRANYADRMGRYEIDPAGNLTAFAGSLREDGPNQELLNPLGKGYHDIYLPGGQTLKVQPSRQYHIQRRAYRDAHVAPLPTLPTPPPVGTEPANAAVLEGWKEPYVKVMVYGEELLVHPILPDRTFFMIIDSWYFDHPDLWLTTNQLRELHHVRATVKDGAVVVKVIKSIPLQLPVKPEFDTAIGLDPQRNLLYILLPTGERFWFDPQSLEARGQDKLPGVWEREYGQVSLQLARREFPQYSQAGGWPLTEEGYLRLMRVLTVIFIGSLLWLTLELIGTWKFTSARTTADSN
jgi:hypothetical protein